MGGYWKEYDTLYVCMFRDTADIDRLVVLCPQCFGVAPRVELTSTVCDSAPAVTSLVTVDHAPVVTLYEQEI